MSKTKTGSIALEIDSFPSLQVRSYSRSLLLAKVHSFHLIDINHVPIYICNVRLLIYLFIYFSY